MPRFIRINLFFLALSLFLLFTPKNIYAAWYFPMDKYYERQTVKGFGQYIDNNFYKGKENLFPYNRFYGYHSGIDLEIFPEGITEKVPVYAISSGTVTFIGTLSGYGGVILEKLDNENASALYGHVKIQNLSFKVGDRIDIGNGPVILTYLGDQFSAETSKERKHLHFGIHKGIDLYFKGHESSLAQVEAKWFDPNQFLEERKAIDPLLTPTPTVTPDNTTDNLNKKMSFLDLLINFLKGLFNLKSN